MNDLGSLIASFGVDTSQLNRAEAGLRGFDRSAQVTFQNASNYASSFGSQLVSLVGVTLSLGGAVALVHKAVSSWYSVIKSGIGAVENFKKELISTSYLLAAQSEVEPPELGEAYSAWGEYYKWMRQEAVEADKAVASGMVDIMAVATQLLKKGVKAESREAFEVIARLTDVMKGAIPAYASLAMQARGEIEALLSGVTRMGAQTAIILAGIDPEFKKNIANARATRTELEYLNKLLPQIKQYNIDMMGTLDAVTSSMKSAWNLVQIEAFGNAHKEIVGFIAKVGDKLVENGKLTEQGEELAKALGKAWASAKEQIIGFVDYIINNSSKLIEDIGLIASTIGTITGGVFAVIKAVKSFYDSVNSIITRVTEVMVIFRAFFEYLGEAFLIQGKLVKDVAHGMIWDFSEIPVAVANAYSQMNRASEDWKDRAIRDANDVRFAVSSAMKAQPMGKFSFMLGAEDEFEGYETPLIAKLYPKVKPPLKTPSLRPPSDEGKEGKGVEKAERDLKTFLDSMVTEIAKAQDDSIAGLNIWYSKQAEALRKITETLGEQKEAQGLMEEAYWAKAARIAEGYYDWLAKESGDETRAINRDMDSQLQKHRYIYDEMGNVVDNYWDVEEVRQRKLKESRIKMDTEWLGLQKGGLDALAGAAPFLSDQLALREKSLNIENQITRYQTEQKLESLERNRIISSAQADEMRGLMALTEQAKKFALERDKWATEGVVGGLKMAAYAQIVGSETYFSRMAFQVYNDMKEATSSALAQGFIDFMDNKKGDVLTQMATRVRDYLIKGMMSAFTEQIWTAISKMLMESFNIIIPTFQSGVANAGMSLALSGKVAGMSLEQGGMNAGLHLVTAASQAAAILSGASLGMSGWGQGAWPSLDTMVSGSSIWEWMNFTGYQHGGVVVGERGPEVIMPLESAPGGGLGISVMDRGEPQEVRITLINETGVPARARVQGDSLRDLKIFITRIVADDIAQGGVNFKTITRMTTAEPRPYSR